MNINGMTNMEDVINMIKDTIDEGRLEDAKDYLDQLKDKGKPIAEELSEDKHQGREEIPMPFPDARDQHLISKNLNKATGGK